MAKIKTTGAELKRFWSCDDERFWPADAYVEGVEWTVNGVDASDVDVEHLNDNDIVSVDGCIYRVNLEEGEKDIAGVMRKWRLLQTHSTFAVEIPNDQKQVLDAFLKTIKGKII